MLRSFSEPSVQKLVGCTVPYVYVRHFQDDLLPMGAHIIEQATTEWGTQEWIVETPAGAMVFAQRH